MHTQLSIACAVAVCTWKSPMGNIGVRRTRSLHRLRDETGHRLIPMPNWSCASCIAASEVCFLTAHIRSPSDLQSKNSTRRRGHVSKPKSKPMMCARGVLRGVFGKTRHSCKRTRDLRLTDLNVLTVGLARVAYLLGLSRRISARVRGGSLFRNITARVVLGWPIWTRFAWASSLPRCMRSCACRAWYHCFPA